MSVARELEVIRLKLSLAEITEAHVSDDALIVELADGRTISAPIDWFPRLAYGSPEERSNLVVNRDSLHWPDLDEDIGLPTLLLGRGLGESPQSLQKWLEQRQQKQPSASHRPKTEPEKPSATPALVE